MLKTKTKVKISVAGLMLAISALLFSLPPEDSSAAECTSSPCNTTFQVNVQESLSVSITTPQTWASGNAGDFLRNKISLGVSTNSASGFVAYMHSRSTTNLTNAVSSTYTIPTLQNSDTRGGFDDDRWGYSLQVNGNYPSSGGKPYNETDAGNDNSNYYPMSTSDIQILDGTTSGTRGVYFGAKASNAKASGTYIGTVVFTVVTSGTPSSDPATPTDDNPSPAGGTDNGATYDSVNNRTVHTTTSSDNINRTNTITTQVSAGDNTDNTALYAPAQGETRRTESNISNGSQAATGLAIAASTAAAGGMVFFILAKRREDDEEDEEELQ